VSYEHPKCVYIVLGQSVCLRRHVKWQFAISKRINKV